MPELPRFHLAIAVDDLAAARAFYVDVLGCGPGRTAEDWVDLDFYGHQVSLHRIAGHSGGPRQAGTNPVDGDQVPVPHFGLILEWNDWHELSRRLSEQGVRFVIEPRIRFAGQPGEQATMFFRDPAGNALEVKSFRHDAQVFAKVLLP